MRKVCVALGGIIALLTILAPASTHPVRAQASVYHATNISNQQAPADSRVWSGYAITGSAITSVTGTVTLPQMSCAPWGRSEVAFWVGIDGFNTSTVEQTGVDVICGPDGATYRPWFEMFPLPAVYIDQPVAAGDRVTATVQRTSAHTYALTLHNATASWTYTTTQTAQNDQATTAEWIAERASQRVANFKPAQFEACTADGQAISAYESATPITLESRRMLVPSTLNASGNAFSISSQSRSAPPIPNFNGWPPFPHWLTAPSPHDLSGHGWSVPPWPWLNWGT